MLNKFSPLSKQEKAARLTGSRILTEEEAGPLIYGTQNNLVDEINEKFETILKELKETHDSEDQAYIQEYQFCQIQKEACSKETIDYENIKKTCSEQIINCNNKIEDCEKVNSDCKKLD